MGLATRKRSPLTWSAESNEWTRRQVLARKMNEDPLFQRERRYRPVKEESDFMASLQRLSLVATLCAFVALTGAELVWRFMFGDTVCLDEEQCCFIYYAQYLLVLYYGVYEKLHLYPKRVQSVVAYEDSVSFLRYHYSTKFSLHLLNCWSRTFKQKNQELSNTGTEPCTKVLALMVIPCSFCETLKDWVGGWASSVDLFKRWGLRHWE